MSSKSEFQKTIDSIKAGKTVPAAKNTQKNYANQNVRLSTSEKDKKAFSNFTDNLKSKVNNNPYFRTDSVKEKLEQAQRKRDEASKKRQNYSGKGAWLINASPEASAAMQKLSSAEADAEFMRWDNEYNRLRAELYAMENDDALSRLGKDAAAQSTYAAGQTAREDKRTLYESLLPTSIPGADLPMGYQDTVGRQKRNDYKALTEKYGAKDIFALGARIGAAEREAGKELEAQGYNFDRMVDYQQRQKDAAARAAEREENLRFADEHGFLASAATVGAAPVQGLDYLSIAGQTIQNELRGEEDWRPINTDKLHVTNYVTDIRGRVGENIEESTDLKIGDQNVARFLYDTGMSMADSATAIAFAGPAATYLLGGAAASQTAMQVLEKGGSGAQATMSGLAAGAAEALFEKYSIDSLLETRNITSVKRLLTGTLKQAGVEATEEMATEVSNIITDALIMGQNSDFNRSVDFYMSAEGGSMTAQEAKKQAIMDCIGQIMWAGVGGALSGGAMSVGANTMQLADNAYAAKMMYGNDPEALIGQTMAVDKENQLAKKLQDRVRNKQNISGLQLSTLNEQRMTAFEKQEAAQKKKGETALTIEKASQKYGKNAVAMKETYESDQDVKKFADAFDAMYRFAKNGVAYEVIVDDESVQGLREHQKKRAYDIGRTADGAVELADVVSEYEVSAEGKTVHKGTDKAVELGEVVSVNGGTMIFALNDGSEAASTELSYATEDEAMLYYGVNYAANTAQEANALIRGFKDSGMSAEAYSKGIRHAYNYGRHNLPVGQMANIQEVKSLPAEARKTAYKAGQQLREHRTKQKQAELDKLRAKNPTEGKAGRVLMMGATKNTAEDGGVKYSQRNFAEQVDEVLAGTFDRTNAVYLGETPSILSDIGLDGSLPMLTTAKHLKNASRPKNAKKHQHGLTDTQLKNLPNAIANPVMILDSLGTTSNSVVVVTDMLDQDKMPVIVAIQADGKGMYNSVEIDTNFVLSYYGRSGFDDYLKRHLSAGNLLYYNKQKSDTLSNRANVQFVGQLKEYRSDIILRKTNANVNLNKKLSSRSKSKGSQEVQTFREHLKQSGQELTSVQEASIFGMERLAALMGVDMYVYESYLNKDGERVYTDEHGREYAAPNGYYENGKVYIDLNAGDRGEGTMLYTVSHELTHFIQEWSPAKYDTLCSIIMDGYAVEGISVDHLVRKQIAKAAENGRTISYEEAYDEVVADSMESMLADGQVIEMMAEIKKQDRKLWEKIRDFFADLLEDLKMMVDVYGHHKPNSKEGKMVADMQKVIDKIQPLFAEALLEAGETYQAVETKNTTEDGGVRNGQYSFRNATAIDGVEQAEQMERDGKSREEIWSELGVIRDAAGNWVTEIDDSNAKFYGAGDARLQSNPDWLRYKELESKMIHLTITEAERQELQELSRVVRVLRRGTTLQDYLKHDELYRAAPYLKDIPFRMEIMGRGPKGKYDKSGILIDNGQNAEERLSTTLHETQHAIQDAEGRPSGENVEYWQKRLYNGEIIRKNDKRIAAARDRRAEAWDKMPEALKSKVREINRESIAAKESGNYDRLTELQTELFNSEDADLYAEYDNALWEERLYAEYNEPLSAQNLYYQTAGEIEARLVQQRRNMTAEQRRAKMPNFQWDDAVFAEKNRRRYSDRNYSYNELVAKSDIQGRVIPKDRTVQLTADGSIDKTWVVSEVLKQCESVATKAPVPTYFVNVPDVGKNVEVTTKGITHGFIKSESRNGKSVPESSMINARVALDLPWILQNSVEVNRSKRDGNNEVEFTHIMIGVSALENADGNVEYYVVRSVVEARKNQGAILTEANVIGKLHAMKAKKMNAPQAQDGNTGSLTSNAFAYTVSDLLDNVKQIYDDTFSNDVYEKLGMQRTENDFSKHLLFSDRNRKSAATLERENKRLKEDVKYLRELVRLQKKVTNGTRMKRRDVENMAKLLMKNNSIKGDYRELTPMLTELYEFMAINENIDADTIREKAQPAVNWMLDHVQEKTPLDPYAEEILGVLKSSSVRFSDSQKAEAAYLYDGWGKYRNSVIGAVHVTDNATQTLDQLWADLAASYPKTFDADISDAQQPAALLETIEELRNMKEEAFDFDPALLEQGFLQDVYDGYWRVSTLNTVADEYQERIAELKRKHMQEMEESKAMLFKAMNQQRKDYQRAMDAFLAREAEEIHKQKTEYATDRRKAVEKRKKTARKKSIQKTAQKLDTLLNRGTKEKNIKEGMQEFVTRALTAANAIMQTEDELDYIRFGVAVDLSNRELKLFGEAKELLTEIDNYWDIHDAYDSYDEIKKAINGLERSLKELQSLHGREIAARKKLGMDVSEDFSVVDMINDTIHCFISNREAQVVEAAKAQMHRAYSLKPDEVGMYVKMKKLESKLNYRMRMLSEVFERERIRRDKMTVSTVLNDLATSYKALEDATGYLSGAYDGVVYDFLNNLNERIGSTNIKDMSLYQLECIDEAFTMVLTTVNNVNEAFTDERKRGITEMGEAAMSELGAQKQIKDVEVKGTGVLKKMRWDNLKPVYAFERIGSAILKERYEAVRKGEDVYAQDITEARQFYLGVAQKYGAKNWDLEERVTFEDADGREFKLNRDQMMSVYAYARRKQAHEHLLQGGIVFDENTDIKGEKIYGVPVTLRPTTANTHRIDSDVLQKISSTLTEDQRLFAQEMQDYLSDDMAAKGNEVSLRMYGVKLFKEKHYFPLHSAAQFNRKAAEQQEAGEHSPRRLKNNGMTKAVTPEANNPIILSGFMDTWSGHVDEMSMYHSFVLPLEDFNRVFKYMTPTTTESRPTSVDAAMQNAHGKAATQYVTQLINDLNGGARSDSRETPMKSLVAKWKKAAVFTSASVVIQQPSSIARAFALISPTYFRPSDFAQFGEDHTKVWNEVKKYAPVAIIKEMGYFDTDMSSSTAEFLTKKEYAKGRESIEAFVKDSQYRDDVLSTLPAYADEMTWCTIWGAVKREQALKHTDLKTGSDEFLQLCGERFTEIITKTQVYDSVLARSGNMRSKSLYMNMATAFLAEPTTSINMVEDALYKMLRGGDKKTCAKQIGAVVASVVLNSMLVSLVYAARDDDEDETYLEKYISRLTEETLDGLNPLTYLPFLKDFWSIYQGYDVERADMALVTDIVDSINHLRRLSEKNVEDMDADELEEHTKAVNEARWEFVDYATAFAGISVKNVRRDFKAIFNLARVLRKDLTERDTTALSLADVVLPVVGLMDEKTAADKLYYATVKGDTAYVKRLSGTYETEKARDAAIRKGLRANDPRVKEAAVLYINRDYEGCRRVYQSILNEKHFSENNVVKAIQAEINALTPDEATEETVAKIEGIFNEENFVQSLADGRAGTAETIKQDVIRTYVANGSSQTDAEKSFRSKTKTAIREFYMDGELSADEALDYFVTYAGMDEVTATNSVRAYTWMRNNLQYDFTVNQALAYTAPIEGLGVSAQDCGISPNVFAQYQAAASDCVGVDKDGDGEADSNSRKNQVLAVIDSLPISNSQKDALYLMNGWAKSNLRKAPWH